MALSRDEIYTKVQGVLVDALGVDEEEVTPKARLSADLGAESIDYLDIVFRLEKVFSIKIPRGELFPEDMATMQNDPTFVQDGKITDKGLAELKKRIPYTDFTEFEKDPTVEKAQDLLTVDMITNYVATKLG
jgi:acyl carrier protein